MSSLERQKVSHDIMLLCCAACSKVHGFSQKFAFHKSLHFNIVHMQTWEYVCMCSTIGVALEVLSVSYPKQQ